MPHLIEIDHFGGNTNGNGVDDTDATDNCKLFGSMVYDCH